MSIHYWPMVVTTMVATMVAIATVVAMVATMVAAVEVRASRINFQVQLHISYPWPI